MPRSDSVEAARRIMQAVDRIDAVAKGLLDQQITPRKAARELRRIIHGPLAVARVRAEFAGDITQGRRRTGVRAILAELNHEKS